MYWNDVRYWSDEKHCPESPYLLPSLVPLPVPCLLLYLCPCLVLDWRVRLEEWLE